MKPKYVYHGSITAGIKELEPRKRYTPTKLGENAEPAIYAAADPAYAAGHAFPWESSEGIDVYELDGKVILKVPKVHKRRLEQEIFIYKLPSTNFKLLKRDNPKVQIYFTYEKVKPVEVRSFKNVKEAIQFFGGEIDLY